MNVLENFDFFLEFEKKTNIFFIKNDKGIYLWDIFRYWVRERLSYYSNTISNNSLRKKYSVLWLFKCFVVSLRHLYVFFMSRKIYDNLFFMASRNQYDCGFIDQNAFDTYRLLCGQKNLLIETWCHTKYRFYMDTPFLHSYFTMFAKLCCYYRLSKSDKNCIHEIYDLLKKNFSEISFSEQCLYEVLKKFYRDVFLWTHIIKKHRIKRVFLTQNGIQKAFFYVAEQLKVPLYEFQHGIIGRGHAAYSYPQIKSIEDYIYMPAKYLTLSDFWCNNLYYPSPSQSIGNNYFSKSVTKIANPNKILVISADLFGKQLASILKESIIARKVNAADLVFKLHPNQYFEKDYFVNFFDRNVSVLTDEKSVNELLAEARCMVTVCSTAAYEALQANTRVLVYAISMYKEMELLFSDQNTFLFSTIEELERGMNAPLPADYKPPVFFDKCTPEKIQAAINE